MFLFQKSFIYFPWQELENDRKELLSNKKISRIELTDNDVKLVGYYINNNSKKIVIYFGGNGENIVYSMNEFSKNNFLDDLISFNYPTYGESTGELGEREIYLSSKKILDYVIKTYPDKKIILMGRSLGSGVATHLSQESSVSSIVLVTPYASIEKLAESNFPYLPVSIILNQKYESYKYINAKIPTLIIYAGNDQVVSNKSTEELIKYANENSVILKIQGADHNNISYNVDYWKSIITFVGF